jgi:hypothetical protein
VCHQTVGLVQAELEKRGIPSVSITMLPEVTGKLRLPRALEVPYPLGFPLGRPNDAALQTAIIRAAFGLLSRDDVPFVEQFKEVKVRG